MLGFDIHILKVVNLETDRYYQSELHKLIIPWWCLRKGTSVQQVSPLMPYSADTARILAEPLVTAFFRSCEGDWRSERRYYKLKSGDVQEVVSYLNIQFLDKGDPKLSHLEELHGLSEATPLVSGAQVTWESNYVNTSKKPVNGSTLFGVRGSMLYRDRGFATPKPVTADFMFREARTMVLKTAYSGSSFEEEIKLIGDHTRTRQTIISRAGEEIMIGQYLEQRC